MCIATICHIENKGWVLTHSRDESINRPFLEDLTKRKVNEVDVFYPEDSQSKGTWILNSEKVASCILNGAFQRHTKKSKHTKSRGRLLFDIQKTNDLEKVFNLKELQSTEPFTILSCNKITNQKTLLIWDEKKLHKKDIPTTDSFIWMSATLYKDEKKEIITQHFQNQTFNSSADIMNWHKSQKMNLGDIHPLIKTVCYTQIELDQPNLLFTFIK